MLSLAAFRYRNVLAEYGGPIAQIQTGELPVRGRKVVLANATLKEGLTRKSSLCLYSAADGTGVHENAAIARHMAVSEALERWAFAAIVRSDRAQEFGFDIDPTTCGMCAYPGLFDRQARERSVLEAIERFSLMAWWEGKVEGRRFDTDWPGVSAVAIDGPFGGMTVVVYARTQWGYAYGHAAAESFSGACERAIFELARHESILRTWGLLCAAGERKIPTHVFERRTLFFASEEGYELFRQRLETKPTGPMPAPEIISDAEIEGPWSEFATVWRFALRPPSDGHLRGGDKYFFV